MIEDVVCLYVLYIYVYLYICIYLIDVIHLHYWSLTVRDVLAEVGCVPVVGAFRLLGSQLAGGGGGGGHSAQSVAAPNCVGALQGLWIVPHL